MTQKDQHAEPNLTPDELARKLFQATPSKDWDEFATETDAESESLNLNEQT